MACVNPNSPEFKKILEIEPNPLLAEIIYNEKYGQMQNENFANEEIEFQETKLDSKTKLDFSNKSEDWVYKKTDQINEIDNYVLDQLIKQEGKTYTSSRFRKI